MSLPGQIQLAFSPEQIRVLTTAFDAATAQTLALDDSTREMLACLIMQIAANRPAMPSHDLASEAARQFELSKQLSTAMMASLGAILPPHFQGRR